MKVFTTHDIPVDNDFEYLLPDPIDFPLEIRYPDLPAWQALLDEIESDQRDAEEVTIDVDPYMYMVEIYFEGDIHASRRIITP
jgi:hypothetical protein